MDINEIKNLVEKFAGNFSGEDLAKVKANGEDLIETISKFSGGLGGIAKAAMGKFGLGDNIEGAIEKFLGGFGSMANTANAKTDLGNLTEAIKKFIGK